MTVSAGLHRVARLILLAGALAGTFGFFLFVGLQVAIRTREVPTPDLRGLAPQEAIQILAERGLQARFDSQRRIHPAIEAGRIAAQDPRPGINTRRRRNVKLWISSGPNAGEAPALIGESETGCAAAPDRQRFRSRHRLGDPFEPLSHERRGGAGSAAGGPRRTDLAAESTGGNAGGPMSCRT